MRQQLEIVAATMATLMALEPDSKDVLTAMALDTPTGLHKLLVKSAADPEKFHTNALNLRNTAPKAPT